MLTLNLFQLLVPGVVLDSIKNNDRRYKQKKMRENIFNVKSKHFHWSRFVYIYIFFLFAFSFYEIELRDGQRRESLRGANLVWMFRQLMISNTFTFIYVKKKKKPDLGSPKSNFI